MAKIIQILATLFLLVIANLAYSVAIQETQNKLDESERSCSTEDLNRSYLDFCDALGCQNENARVEWPKERGKFIHMYSSRSDERFVVESLPRLDFLETENERMFNINTTIYADTTSTHQEIIGFGATFGAETLLSALRDGKINTVHAPIIRDLFSKNRSGTCFNLFRVQAKKETLLDDEFPTLLKAIDDLLAPEFEPEIDTKVQVMISLSNTAEHDDGFRGLPAKFDSLKVLQFLAMTYEINSLEGFGLNRALLDYTTIYAVTSYRDAPNLVVDIQRQHVFDGIIIKGEHGLPYSVLEEVNLFKGELNMLSIGRKVIRETSSADWRNAQDIAVQVLRNLEYGSSGFIEDVSYVSNTSEPLDHIASIINLHQHYRKHVRAPIFYAIGHFSRYLVPGSRRLKLKVFTQPNMFAAHYLAFSTPHNHIVLIVLNDNEHVLPFRAAIDDRISAHIDIKPKSFNTIVIKR